MENENKIVKPAGSVIKQLLVLLLLGLVIWFFEGISGFKPFINLEMLLIVLGGTFLLTWSAYPLKEIFSRPSPAMYYYAANCSVAMAVISTVLSMMLILFSIADITQVPRRLVLGLNGLFFGLVLSEVFLVPAAERLNRAVASVSNTSSGSAGKRMFMGILGLGIMFIPFLFLLYALSAAPSAYLPPEPQMLTISRENEAKFILYKEDTEKPPTIYLSSKRYHFLNSLKENPVQRKEYVKKWIKNLNDSESEIRKNSLVNLYFIREKSALPAIKKLKTNDPDYEIRKLASELYSLMERK